MVDGLVGGRPRGPPRDGRAARDVERGRRARRLRAAPRRRGRGPRRDASTRSWPSGAVIRGETDHYEHIAREASTGLGRGRARDRRAGGLRRADRGRRRRRPWPARRAGPDNKGAEAARAAVAMVARSCARLGRRGARRGARRATAERRWAAGPRRASARSRCSTSGTSPGEPMDRVAEGFWRVRTTHGRDAGHGRAAGAAGAQARVARRRRGDHARPPRTGASTASPPVDRNILRLGAYELMQEPETPAAVVIDEAVEMAQALRRSGLARVRERRAGRDPAQACRGRAAAGGAATSE